jgi:hypothetical protein
LRFVLAKQQQPIETPATAIHHQGARGLILRRGCRRRSRRRSGRRRRRCRNLTRSGGPTSCRNKTRPRVPKERA